jgi:hypothetical protein
MINVKLFHYQTKDKLLCFVVSSLHFVFNPTITDVHTHTVTANDTTASDWPVMGRAATDIFGQLHTQTLSRQKIVANHCDRLFGGPVVHGWASRDNNDANAKRERNKINTIKPKNAFSELKHYAVFYFVQLVVK